jgi:polyisoprenoid-binding protein YceI
MICEIDSIRSRVSFAIRVMSVTTTRGSFDTLQGQLHIDEQNPANSWVEAEVDAASINTHNILRDTHLRSNAFFAVKKYPTIAFKSTRVEHIGDSAYKVTGNLTLFKRLLAELDHFAETTSVGERGTFVEKGCEG